MSTVLTVQDRHEDQLRAARTALEEARHALVVTEGLRATDLTAKQFEAALARGVARGEIEWTLDQRAPITAIDAALAQLGEP